MINSRGFVLIFAGIILLLNVQGIVSWDIWNVLLRFWPVFLILAGVEILLGKSFAAGILYNLIVIVVLAVIGAYALSVVHPGFGRWLRQRVPFLPAVNRIDRSPGFYRPWPGGSL